MNALFKIIATIELLLIVAVVQLAGTPDERLAMQVFVFFNIACVILLIWRRR